MPRLNRAMRQQLVEILVAIPTLDSPSGRNILLQGLPPALVRSIPRSAAKMIDLQEILAACETWEPALRNEDPLLLLIENASLLTRGSKEAVILKKLLASLPLQSGHLVEPPVSLINPYRGLMAFREEDADFFYGREAFVEKLVTTVRKQPLTAVIGAPGSGKSSVVFAGLVPRLRSLSEWLLTTPDSYALRVSDHPFESLATALLSMLEPKLSKIDRMHEANMLAEALHTGAITLTDVVERVQYQHPKTRRMLLVIDQFEELYTLCQTPTERERFLDVLLAAASPLADDKPHILSLVLILRADFLGQVVTYRPAANAIQNGTLILGPMAGNELRGAIELPAKNQGVAVERELTLRLLEDMAEEPSNLPFLEFVLTLLWEKKHNNYLTHAAYEALGGIGQALNNYAEDVYEQLRPEDQRKTQHICLRLIQLGEGTSTAETLRVRDQADFIPEEWVIIKRLAAKRLLIISYATNTHRDTVQLAHEALIIGWHRLRQWVEAARQPRAVSASVIKIAILKGSGMLVGESSDLTLRVINQSEQSLAPLKIEIQRSAEYEVIGECEQTVPDLEAGASSDIQFTIKVKMPKQITVNYYIDKELSTDPIYINAIKDNPYQYGNPVKEETAFFGRQDELDQIIQAVTKPTKQDILLVGERRSGKTSLLYQLKQRLGQPFIPVYIVLNTCEPFTNSILDHVIHGIVHALIHHGVLDKEQWKQELFSSTYFVDRVHEIIDAARASLPDVKIVLLIDEADYLLNVRPSGFLNWISYYFNRIKGKRLVDERVQNVLRATLQSSEIGVELRAVVAGTTDLSTYISQRSSPFFNHFRFVPLKPLSVSDTHDLIVRSASALGYDYTPTAIDRITHLCGGQPYYCQALCYEAFNEALRDRRNHIGDTDVSVAEKKIIEDLFNSYRSGFWKRAAPPERSFLAGLAAGQPNHAVTPSQVKRLLDWQLIREVDGEYLFLCGLFRTWTLMATKKG